MKHVVLGLVASGLILPATGCVRPDYEGQVRGRAETLVGHILRGEMDACVAMTDPVFVRAQGHSGVKFRFGLIRGVAKVGQLTEEDVRIGEVVVSEDARTAQVRVSIRQGEEWKPLDPMRWVRVEDTWYVTF
jgi:hypothetical protein